MWNELRGGEGPAAGFPAQTVEVSGRSLRATDFIARGIDAVRVNPRFFLGTSTLLVAAWALLEVTVALGSGLGLLFNLLAHLVFLEVAGQIVGVLTCGAMEVVAGDEPSWRSSPKPVGTGVRFSLALALYLFLVLVGLALLVVPGVRLAARYALFPFALFDRHRGVRPAYEHSSRLTRGNAGAILRLQTMLIGLNVAGAAMVGVGFLFSLPISACAAAAAYTELNRAKS